MSTTNNILDTAKRVMQIEANAIVQLVTQLDDNFVQAVQFILQNKSRVIVSGIGKSAIIAQKIVATFNSTGTQAIFMHAADAIHGDLGMINENDTVILISKSGETEEIKVLIPLIKNFGNKIIAICGNENSYLANNADYFLNSFVQTEACPNNLAPTSSTTAQLVIGDALAVCLLELNQFSTNDFAKYHPGGALGKKLYLRVSDVIKNNSKPLVQYNSNIKNIILEITSNRLGATAVMDNNNLAGIITDGDLRRMMQDGLDLETTTAKDIMNANPKTILADAMAVDALQLMKQNNIGQLIVLNENKEYEGIVHIQDLLREGIV